MVNRVRPRVGTAFPIEWKHAANFLFAERLSCGGGRVRDPDLRAYVCSSIVFNPELNKAAGPIVVRFVEKKVMLNHLVGCGDSKNCGSGAAYYPAGKNDWLREKENIEAGNKQSIILSMHSVWFTKLFKQRDLYVGLLKM